MNNFIINYLKKSSKLFFHYIMADVSVIVLLPVMALIAKDNPLSLVPIFSFVFFIVAFLNLFSYSKSLGTSEKIAIEEFKAYPFKGFALGFIAFAPILLIELICVFLVPGTSELGILRHKFINALLGPLYWFIKLCGESTTSYIIANIFVPIITGLAYLCGYYGIGLSNIKSKFSKT